MITNRIAVLKQFLSNIDNKNNFLLVLYVFILAFFSGGYLRGGDYGNITINGFLTLNFSAILVYVALAQKKINESQLDINKSQMNLYSEITKPTLIIERLDNDDDCFFIKNVGDTSAYNINYSLYNEELKQGDEDNIEEIYSKYSLKINFPDEWIDLKKMTISININYQCNFYGGEETRNCEHIFHIIKPAGYKKHHIDDHWSAVV